MAFRVPDGCRLLRPVGTGTFFDVAEVEEAGVLLACKRLRPRLLRDPAGRAALAREARTLAACAHPALPVVTRVGADDAGPFLLETWTDGASLEAVRDAWRARGEPLPDALFAHLAREAARTLAELHELPAGFVHGDLAPDNVLLAPTGEVRLLDFGLSSAGGPPPEGAGTLPYAAPERVRGEPSDAATDVYALAATLASLASDGPLVEAKDDAAAVAEVGERGLAPRPRADLGPLGREAWAALAEALRFARTERLSSARALAERLSR